MVFMDDSESGADKVDKHAPPVCEGWQKMQASGDTNAYMLAAIEEAKTKLAAIHCVDCSAAVMASGRLSGVTPDEERAFILAHAGHKMEASMYDGRVLPLASATGVGVAAESKP
jgi:fatty acid-binding protein DegV